MITILVVIYIVFISLGLPDSLFGVAWPLAHADFQISENFASLYGIVTGITSGGAGLFAGPLLRKFGTPIVSFVSIILTVVGIIGMSFSPNIWILMACSMILGLGAGAIDTGLNNYVSLHYKARHMSWLHCFWGVGVTLSPLIMSGFLTQDVSSWRYGYRVVAIIQGAIALIVLLFIKKWRKIDNLHKDNIEQPKSKKSVNIFKIKGVVSGICSLGFYCAIEFTIGTWGATYIVNTSALSPSEAAKWISAYYGGIMLGRLVSGFASMKFSDNVLIRSGIVISVFGIILLMLPIGSWAFAGFALIGFGFGPIFPSIIHSVPERFGAEFSADLTGFHMGGAYAIGFAIQLAFGYIASATSFVITPFVFIAFAILCFLTNELTIKKLQVTK